MHTEKQKIFDEYSQNIDPKLIQMGIEELEIDDWEDLLIAFRYGQVSLPNVTRIIFEVCDLVQKTQQRRIADKALVSDGENSYESITYTTELGHEVGVTIDFESIHSEQNLIK